MTVSGVQTDITKEEISTLMDAIIENNIFNNKSGDITGKSGANVTQRKIIKYDLA